MAREIFLIQGVDKEVMQHHARKLVREGREEKVTVHAHPYNIDGECNEDCEVYSGKVPTDEGESTPTRAAR